MSNRISLTKVSDLTGISKGSIESYIKDDNPEYRLLKLERGERNQLLFDEKAIEKVVVFYIYKSSQTVAPSQEIKSKKERGKGETKELIKKFNEKYNEQEPLEILLEVSKTYNEVYYLFKESKEANKLEEKIKIYVRMIALISINLKSNLGIEGEITRSTKKIGEGEDEYEYDRVFKGEELIIAKFSKNTIDKMLDNYRKPYSHYFEEINLYESTIIDMIQKSETSSNQESRLLKENRDYFNFFQDKLKNFTYEELWKNGRLEDIKKEFYVMSKEMFERILGSMLHIIGKLEIVEIARALEPIDKRIANLSESQKEFHRDLPLRNYSEMFMYIDEVLDFYNSPQGKLLNEYFKKHNLMVEFFENIKKYTSYSNYYKGDIDDIKLSLTRDIKFPMRCLGYDYEYKYHMLHDAFELMQYPERMREAGIIEDKLLEAVSKILSHGSFDVNSRYQGKNLLEKAIATNNPNAVKVLKGYIENVQESVILSACYDHADTEGMIRSVLDCINDINTKAYYQAIYEGDYELVDILMERGRVEPISKKYSIEIYLCTVGKNPKEVSKVLMANIDKYHESESFFRQSPTNEEIKLSFIEVSILWGVEEVVKENIDFLNSIDRNNPLLEKILALLLRRNYLEIFKEIFENRGFDPSRICYIFIDTNEVPSTEVSKETWKYMLEDAFKDIDINKIFSNPSHCYRPHEATIEGLAKEKFHFTYASMDFLEKLYKETSIFKMAFKDVKRKLKENPDKTVLCYMGLKEEYERNPQEYYRKQEEKYKKIEENWVNQGNKESKLYI